MRSTTDQQLAAPLTPGRLEDFIEELPAEMRAKLSWAPKAMRDALNRLLEEPLTPEAIAQATAEVTNLQADLLRALALTPPFLSKIFESFLEQALPQQMNVLMKLSGKDRRAAVRAAYTTVSIAKLAFQHAVANPIVFEEIQSFARQQLPDLNAQELLAGLRSTVVLLALLHLLETKGEALGVRATELAHVADAEARSLAGQIAAGPLQVQLPWYFRPREGAEQFEMFAAWAEEQLSSGDRAASLLKLWRSDDPAEQRAAWESIRKSLDEDRSSSRKLFP